MQNKKFFSLMLLASLLAFSPLYAETEHDEHDEHEELVLSAKVIQNYGIEIDILEKNTPFVLPREAFVNAQGDYFLYKQEAENVFEQVEIHLIKKTNSEMFFTSDDLSAGEKVVIKGAKFLRVILLDKEGGEVGHAH
ncbi:MAG: hypothetical protein PHE89_00910 [Alphaproteobacteria bacterium]|nr:hypothetical protein [Alphaproteobacteria bacterium]